jgi:hypothetical protein
MRFAVAVLAVFGGFGVACGEESQERSGPEQFSFEKRQFVQLYCTCGEMETEVQGVDSPCVRSYLGDQSACEEDVLEDYWDELQDGGECLSDAYRTAKECLRDTCNVMLDGCLRVLQNASARCPVEVQEAFMTECN